MKLKSLGLAVAALGLATAPVAAQAVASDRSAPIASASELEGQNGVLIAVLAAAAVIAGIVIIADDDDDDDAVSA